MLHSETTRLLDIYFWWAYSSLALTQTLQCAFMCIDVKPRRYYAAMIWYWYKYLQLTIHVHEYLASGGWTQSFTNAIQRGSSHQPSLVAASWSGCLYLHRCMYTILGCAVITCDLKPNVQNINQYAKCLWSFYIFLCVCSFQTTCCNRFHRW